MVLSGRSIEMWNGLRSCHEHEKDALITAGASNFGKLRSKYDCRDKRPTLASMAVMAAKPVGRPRKILEMLLDKTLHTPGQSVVPALASTGRRL